MKNFILLLFLSFISLTVYGAKISSDELKLGKAGSVADKVINLGPLRQIRSNETSGVLEFSNDGALFKKLGSGSGTGGSGGVSVLLNSSFEDGLVNWTNSGGTFTQETFVNGVEGNVKYGRFVATGAGQYIETDLTTFADSISNGSMADFRYLQADDAFDFLVIDGGATVVSSQSISDVASWQKVPTATFDVPTSAKIRIISTGAGTIDVDDAYLGSNKGFISGQFVNSINLSGNDGRIISGDIEDIHFSGSGTGWTSVGDTHFYTVQKNNSVIHISINTLGTSHNSAINLRLNDTTNIRIGEAITATTLSGSFTSAIGQFVAGDQLSFRFETSGSTLSNSAPFHHLEIVEQSLETQEAFTPEQADFFIDVSIGGGNANISNNSVPQPVEGSTLDMVLNKGGAKIPCDSTNPPTGLTCSVGDEVVGVVFNAPRSGDYKACFSFVTDINATAFFRLGETSLSSQVIIQQGTSIGGIGGSGHNSHRVCHTFSFGSIGDKVIKLFYESTGTGAVVANRTATAYERDVNITVEMVGHNVSRPILQNMVVSSNADKIFETDGCQILNSGTPTLSGASCASWVDNLSDDGLGNTAVNFKTGIFSDGVNCKCIPQDGFNSCCSGNIATSSSSSVFTYACSTGAAGDMNFSISCKGRK